MVICSRRPHLTVFALLLGLGLGLGLGLVLALGPAPRAEAADAAKLVLVLDSSGSMKQRVGGDRKIDIAKKALRSVIGRLPGHAQVGLRVYGATVENRRDRGACTDSQLVVPIGTGNRSALRDEIAHYRPYGETPISYSLRQAADDLGQTGRRTVVLVSDGEETCDADPCRTAASLAGRGITLKFDVIGLRVSGAARDQLRCIADRGHGTYYDADNAAQIENSLDKLATRAFRPFRLTGTPVEGSTSQAKAPVVVPGRYTDQLPGRERPLYYTVPRTAPDSTLRVGFTAQVNGSLSNASLQFLAADGTQCASSYGSGYLGLTTAEVSSWRADPDNVCNSADQLLLRVSTVSSDLAGSAFELVVYEEPPLVSDRKLPPAAKPSWQKMEPGRAVKAPVAGVSLSDAPTLTAGTYTGEVLTGETQVYGVDLDWGQRLQVQLRLPPRKGALARALDVSDQLSVHLLGAMRGDYRQPRAPGQPTDTLTFINDDTRYIDAKGTPEIRYLNRTQFDGAAAGSLPGRQYVVISKNRPTGQKRFLVPYTVIVKVIGTPGAGAPEYAVAAPSPTPSSTGPPSSVSPLPPTSAPPPVPLSDSGNGLPVAVAIAIGVGALVLGAGGTALLLTFRRRRRG